MTVWDGRICAVGSLLVADVEDYLSDGLALEKNV